MLGDRLTAVGVPIEYFIQAYAGSGYNPKDRAAECNIGDYYLESGALVNIGKTRTLTCFPDFEYFRPGKKFHFRAVPFEEVAALTPYRNAVAWKRFL
jgi:hypothetical protein